MKLPSYLAPSYLSLLTALLVALLTAPGKCDQYVRPDETHDKSGGLKDLHERLYKDVKHPGKVYYLLMCRVALGHHVRTIDSGRNAVSADDGSIKVFPVSFRELAPVPGVQPVVYYHSLLADIKSKGYRYREIIVFHSNYIYPEYLVAYHRV